MESSFDTLHQSTGLDPEVCRRARMSRDVRFDGEFYLAVRTTGIYCRPICPARPPAEKNVLYFQSAAQAAQAGYRPCLRCRPESAPNSPAWNGTSTTVQRALRLLSEGALNTESLASLAERLGIGERYLRKLFQRELGVSPLAIALNQRLLFAKKLLGETSLPITEVAFASGFGSVRRFNSAVQKQFKLPPSALRKQLGKQEPRISVKLQLQYRPPYDWEGVVNFYGRHAIGGLESVTPDSYRRNIMLEGAQGHVEVRPLSGKNALQLEVQLSDHSLLMQVVARIRRMFDLDANPAAIHQILGQDRQLAPLLKQFPGIRSTGHWSLYEAAVRGIVGQQISTQAARGVLSRLAASACSDDDAIMFPTAAAMAALGDDQFPMPGRRRETLRALCHSCNGHEDDLAMEAVAELKGVGPWTMAMLAMRGDGQPDNFPNKDLALERAWSRLSNDSIDLQEQSAYWRPWRCYAVNLLWRSLSP